MTETKDTIHLDGGPRDGRALCGADADGQCEINNVTCQQCIARHDAICEDFRDGLEPPEAVVPVVFRRWKKKDGGEVLALFPSMIETDAGYCNSYMHLGQHGAADFSGLIHLTKPTKETDEDVQELKRELERIGYRLRVMARGGQIYRAAIDIYMQERRKAREAVQS